MLSQILQRVISLLASGVAGVYYTFSKRPAIQGTATQDISTTSEPVSSSFEESALGQACDHITSTTLTHLVNALDTAERKVVTGVKRATYLVFGVCSGYFVLRFTYRQVRRLVSSPKGPEDNQTSNVDETSPLINGESALDDHDAASPSYGSTTVDETSEPPVPEVDEPHTEFPDTAQETPAPAPEADGLDADVAPVAVEVEQLTVDLPVTIEADGAEQPVELPVAVVAEQPVELSAVVHEIADSAVPEVAEPDAESTATTQEVPAPAAVDDEQPVDLPAAVEEKLSVPKEVAKPDTEFPVTDQDVTAPAPDADGLDVDLLPVAGKAEQSIELPVHVDAEQPVETRSDVSDNHSPRDKSTVSVETITSHDQVENVQAPVAYDARVADSAINKVPVQLALDDPFGPSLADQGNIFSATTSQQAAGGEAATGATGYPGNPSYPSFGNGQPWPDPYGMYGTPIQPSLGDAFFSPPPAPRTAHDRIDPSLDDLSIFGLDIDLESGTPEEVRLKLEYAKGYTKGREDGFSIGERQGRAQGFVEAMDQGDNVVHCQRLASRINDRIGAWLYGSPEGYDPNDTVWRGLPQDIRDSIRSLIEYNENAASHNLCYRQLKLGFKVTEDAFILTMSYGDTINTIKALVYPQEHRPYAKFPVPSGSGSLVQLLDTRPTARQSDKKLNLSPVSVPDKYVSINDHTSQYRTWGKNTEKLAAKYERASRDNLLEDSEEFLRLSDMYMQSYLQALQDGYYLMSQDEDRECWFTVGKFVPFPEESLAMQWAARASVCGHMVDLSVATFPEVCTDVVDLELSTFSGKLDEAAFELEKAFLTSPWCIESEDDAVHAIPGTVLERLQGLQLDAFKMNLRLCIIYRNCAYWILVVRRDTSKISRVEGAKVQVYYPGIPDSDHIYPVAKPSVPAPKVFKPVEVDVAEDTPAVEKTDEPEDVIKGLAGDLPTEVTDNSLSVISNASPASHIPTVPSFTDEQAPLKLDTAVVAIPEPEDAEAKVPKQENTILAEDQVNGATVVDVKEGDAVAEAIHEVVKVATRDACVYVAAVAEVIDCFSQAVSPTQSLPSSEPQDIGLSVALPTGLDAPASEAAHQSEALEVESVSAPVEIEGGKADMEEKDAELVDVDDALRVSSEAAHVKPTVVADEESSKAQRESADAQAAAKRASKKKKKEKKQVNIKKSAAKRAAAASDNDASAPQQQAGPSLRPSTAEPSPLSPPPAAPSSSKPSSPSVTLATPVSGPSASTSTAAVAHSPPTGADAHSATELSQPELAAVLAPGKPLETVEAVAVEKVEISQVSGTAEAESSKKPVEATPSAPPLSWAARAIAQGSSKTPHPKQAAHPGKKGFSFTPSAPLPPRSSTSGTLLSGAEPTAAELAANERMKKAVAEFQAQAQWPSSGLVGTPNANVPPKGSPAGAAKGAARASSSFSSAPYDRPMRGSKAASEAIMEKMKANMSSTFAGGIWQKKE